MEEKIRELWVISRAKWHLIQQDHMTEPEAHHAIEQLAMERRITVFPPPSCCFQSSELAEHTNETQYRHHGQPLTGGCLFA